MRAASSAFNRWVLDYTTATYHFMTAKLVEYADIACAGRIISLLEGGYDKRALAVSSVAHVRALAGLDLP